MTARPTSLRSAVGWLFCAATGITLLSLLAAPPSTRELSAFHFPKNLPVRDEAGNTAGTLAGDSVDIVGAAGWHLLSTYHYVYLPAGMDAAGDLDVLATYYVSPRTDARKFPELYATSPWRSPNENYDGWLEKSSQQGGDGSGAAWLQVDDWQGTYLVSRIDPAGNCTSTTEQVSRHKLDTWRRQPWIPLSWPFSARPEVDQRAVWVRMTVNKRVDGNPRTPQEIERIWRGILAAFSEQTRQSLR